MIETSLRDWIYSNDRTYLFQVFNTVSKAKVDLFLPKEASAEELRSALDKFTFELLALSTPAKPG